MENRRPSPESAAFPGARRTAAHPLDPHIDRPIAPQADQVLSVRFEGRVESPEAA